MARQAVQCGTDTMVATPHRAYGQRRAAPPEWVHGQVLAVQTRLDKEGVPLKVVPGVEIPLGPLVAQELTSGLLLTLGDAGTWALIEPPFDRIPRDGLDNIRAVRDAGFSVVIAHPERCSEIQHSAKFVEDCAGLGCAFQLTTGSILGFFGKTVLRTAETLLAHASEWPLVIASDAHDLHDRGAGMMAQARDRAAALVGEAAAQEMVDARPRSFVTPPR